VRRPDRRVDRIGSGIDPDDAQRALFAESIRKALSIAPARAREVRDRLREQRPLRVVGIDA
jgi:hypothetical protein